MLLPYLEAKRLEAGCDEVGRGCLCGPVVAAAVILPPGFANDLIDDSKRLTKSNREELVHEIKKYAIAWKVAEASVAEINEFNILGASYLAMTRAVEGLPISPEHLLVDGNRFKSHLQIPFDCIVKGDSIYASIAAASILAKVYRDHLMAEYAKIYPGYGWETNVGYPTPAHRAGIIKMGITPIHRKHFRHLPEQLILPFED